jgi:hypothetical protein
MEIARVDAKGDAHRIETCFCDPPLAEEHPYWEKYFELLSVKDAHSRRDCRRENGLRLCGCDCDREQHQINTFAASPSKHPSILLAEHKRVMDKIHLEPRGPGALIRAPSRSRFLAPLDW